MILELPYPDKILWPNGRGHHMQVHRATKSHKAWASMVTRSAKERPEGDFLRLVATFHPKKFGPMPDRDNAGASLKAYQDGIAAALGVDDRNFAEPTVLFGPRVAGGRVVISVEVCPL